MNHELTYVEDDPEGYGDGLSDFYRCSCDLTFQANGDVQAAFDHGRETAPKPVVLIETSGGIQTSHVLREDAEVIEIDWDVLRLDADNDNTVEEIDTVLAEIERLDVAEVRQPTHVGMPTIVAQLKAARTTYIEAHGR